MIKDKYINILNSLDNTTTFNLESVKLLVNEIVNKYEKKRTNLHKSLAKKDRKIKFQKLEITNLLKQKG